MGYSGDNLADITKRLDPAVLNTGKELAKAFTDRGKANIARNTPVETRALRESYKTTPVHRHTSMSAAAQGRSYSMFVWTGRVFTEIEYAPHVEYGTGLWGPKHAKYKIAPKKPGGFLKFAPYARMPNGSVILDVSGAVQKGGTIFTRFVMHPGSPGQYMFRMGAEITEHQFDAIAANPLQEFKRMIER